MSKLESYPTSNVGSEKHSTEDQAMKMIEHSMTNMENRKTTCIVFFNLEKALDRIWQDRV